MGMPDMPRRMTTWCDATRSVPIISVSVLGALHNRSGSLAMYDIC
jgi:hypothetical protein